MPDNSKLINLQFPMGGIDVSTEFQEQPADTTPEAVNVRGVNPDSLRERGGSRAGLIRYIPGPLFTGADLIQHLNVIVDPTGPALGQRFEVPGADWVEDPLYPGNFVPPGGWGYQPNPNVDQPLGPGENGGSGSFTGTGTFEGEGSGGAPPAAFNLWSVSVTYQGAFSDLETTPGNLSGLEFCDGYPDRGEGVLHDGNPIGYVDVADSTAYHAWLVEFGYVGGATTPGEVIASYSLTDIGDCTGPP